MDAQQETLLDIFLPYNNERKNIVESRNLGFVHYTNAQAAVRIIETNEFGSKKPPNNIFSIF